MASVSPDAGPAGVSAPRRTTAESSDTLAASLSGILGRSRRKVLGRHACWNIRCRYSPKRIVEAMEDGNLDVLCFSDVKQLRLDDTGIITESTITESHT